MKRHTKHLGAFRWEGVEEQAYKAEGEPFRNVTRRVLVGAAGGLPCELRYFEIGPGGFSSLERHEHAHAVMVLRGRGRALVGDSIVELAPFDLVHVPPGCWHQFRAPDDEALGFLCLVSRERDRPVLPGPSELEALRRDPEIDRFLRSGEV